MKMIEMRVVKISAIKNTVALLSKMIVTIARKLNIAKSDFNIEMLN